MERKIILRNCLIPVFFFVIGYQITFYWFSMSFGDRVLVGVTYVGFMVLVVGMLHPRFWRELEDEA